jgi:hypothetical protein
MWKDFDVILWYYWEVVGPSESGVGGDGTLVEDRAQGTP